MSRFARRQGSSPIIRADTSWLFLHPSAASRLRPGGMCVGAAGRIDEREVPQVELPGRGAHLQLQTLPLHAAALHVCTQSHRHAGTSIVTMTMHVAVGITITQTPPPQKQKALLPRPHHYIRDYMSACMPHMRCKPSESMPSPIQHIPSPQTPHTHLHD